ncbi:UNVERIFIED_CONTAM: hypothetical protein GTU68_038107, partial [Idotea baltica]|nr:hypothetical protein [Idotea baltica]
QLIDTCLKKETDTIRIGVSGVPGVGKSTFIERFGSLLTQTGKKVAVLTVDPTSSRSKGSILGDKTRMYELVQNSNVFIRPSPSGDSLGGVARKTRESIILLEAAGYDIIIVETVGVGQSETVVHSMVDFFLLLKLAGAGDELQGIKRGIMEIADLIAINKADGDNVKRAKNDEAEFQRAIHMFPPKENGWTTKVVSCSAIQNEGMNLIWKMVQKYVAQVKGTGYFESNRQQQNESWLLQHIQGLLTDNFKQNKRIVQLLPKFKSEVMKGSLSPFAAAEKLMDAYRKF